MGKVQDLLNKLKGLHVATATPTLNESCLATEWSFDFTRHPDSAVTRTGSAALCTAGSACGAVFLPGGPHQVCGEQARRRARAQIMLASSWGLKRCQWRRQYRLMACSSSAPG